MNTRSMLTSKHTPAERRRYARIKGDFPDAIVFDRVGEHYDAFGQDAITAADVLGIGLLREPDGTHCAGFGVQHAHQYVRELVARGHRVALCDPMKPVRSKRRDAARPGARFIGACVETIRRNHRVPRAVAVRMLPAVVARFNARFGPGGGA